MLESGGLSRLARKNENKESLLDNFIKYRLVIAAVVFMILLVFKIHGSSIQMWDNYISDYADGVNTNSVLFGKARDIRSDEWLVQTPFSMSQTQSGFKSHNPDITLNGQDMMVGYNSPALSLATIGKPFVWGYVLLGKEYGLSWYWGVKLIGLILLSFEVGLIITRRNKYLALLASVWIPFSSAIQWWFVSPIGDLTFLALGFLVGIYNYFYYHESKKKKLCFAAMAGISVSGFVLVLYPAYQVPMGYLILFFLIGFFIEFRKKVKLEKWDIAVIGTTVAVSCVIIGSSIYISWDSIKLVMNTAYPGLRLSVGGFLDRKQVLLSLSNWKMPFTDISFLNNSEASSFYHFFFPIALASPLFLKKWRENYYGVLLLIYSALNLFWICVQSPIIVAKLTLYSFVPSPRAIVSFGFGSVLLSIWFLSWIWEKKLPYWVSLPVTGIVAGLYAYAIFKGPMLEYLTRTPAILTVAVAGVLTLFFMLGLKKAFAIAFIPVLLLTGATVNPVSRGTAPIYGKTLAKEIQQIEAEDPDQLWAGEGLTYSYLPMMGVHTFNSVAFTPDFDTWKKLDPDGKQKDTYNRYARMMFEVNTTTALELPSQDTVMIRMAPDVVKAYDIKYVVVYKPLDSFETDEVSFEKLYGPDVNNTYIYKVVY